MIELKLHKHDFDMTSWKILCHKCGVSSSYSEIIIGAEYIESNNYDDYSELFNKLTSYDLPKELYHDKQILWNNFGEFIDGKWEWTKEITLLVYGVRRQEIIAAINIIEQYYKKLERGSDAEI